MTDASPEFTREIKIMSSYDYRDDPNDLRGAHGSDINLILRGPLGAISAKISTGWVSAPLTGHYRHGAGAQERSSRPGVDWGVRDVYPSGSYVGSHSYLPREASDASGPCTWLGAAVCYGDGSYTGADEILELLVAGGSDAVFARLEELYQSWIADRPVVAEASA